MYFTTHNSRSLKEAFDLDYEGYRRRNIHSLFFQFVLIILVPVVQRVDNAVHRINYYPVDRVVCFASTYPLNSDLSGG